MKFTVALVFSVACILCVVDQLQSARILAMVPTASYSHQIPYRPLWIELNKRGHDVVLVTADPIPNLNLTNFVQIDVGGSYKVIRRIDFIRYRFEGISWINFLLRDMLPIANNFVEQVFNNTELKKLYAPDSGVKFDVVLSEVLYMPGICAIAHRFKAPFIGIVLPKRFTIEAEDTVSELLLLSRLAPNLGVPRGGNEANRETLENIYVIPRCNRLLKL